MALLTDRELTERLTTLEGWVRGASSIRKEYTFEGFAEAVLFASALVPSAEEADHHPDIEIHGRRVVLTYTTHSEGGLTQKDVDAAATADLIARELPHLTEFSEG